MATVQSSSNVPPLKSYAGLKPIADVPDYVKWQEDLARRSGLVATHLPGAWEGYLLSFYAGTQDQILASHLLTDHEHVRFPKTPRVHSTVSIKSIDPLGSGDHRGHLCRISEERFAVRVPAPVLTRLLSPSPAVCRYVQRPGASEEVQIYVGSQADLVELGASPDLFPNDHLANGSYEQNTFIDGDGVHRCFVIKDSHKLDDGRWSYRHHVGSERWQSELERRKHVNEDREQADRQKAVERNLQSLPPFVPGSMSEDEKQFVRILRGLHDLHYSMVYDLATRLLGRRDEFVEVVDGDEEQPVPPNPGKRHDSKPRLGLRLVVDNDVQE
jgi:hypothetical protein